MKKFYFALAFAASAAMASGTPLSLKQIQHGWRSLDGVGSTSVKVKPVAAWMPGQTRSVDEPQTTFEATSASFYYFGDLLGDGSGVYYLFLSDMAVDKGMPLETGHMARIEFIGNPTDDADPVLAAGTYNVVTDLDGSISLENVVVGPDSEILDVFPYPGIPKPGWWLTISHPLTAN